MATQPTQRAASSDPNARNNTTVDQLNPGSAPEASQPSTKGPSGEIVSKVAENISPEKRILVSTVAAPIKVRLTNNNETIIPPFGKTGEVLAKLVPETLPTGVVSLIAPAAKKE